MAVFACLLVRAGSRWLGGEIDLDGCEGLADIADAADSELDSLDPGRPSVGDADARLILLEEDDEYAAIVRLDDDGQVRAFLSDGHAAARYPVASMIADELAEAGDGEADAADDDDPLDDDLEASAAGYDDVPLGDADIAEDLGTPAAELLRLCEREGMLPIDVLVAVCESAGCAEVFDELRT